jgi:hypothetical protein
MRQVFGIVMCVAGLALGLYLGLWVMFIGGVLDIVVAVKADVLPGDALAWGIAKCVLAQFVGGISAMLLILPGAAIAKT